MPKLIIVRHGAAVFGADQDESRQLTSHGEMEATYAGEWIKRHISLASPKLISSPYLRAIQTAQVIANSTGVTCETKEFLTPDNSPIRVVDFLLEETSDLILVSHQPLVGRLASLLVNGLDSPDVWQTAECRMYSGDIMASGCMTHEKSWLP